MIKIKKYQFGGSVSFYGVPTVTPFAYAQRVTPNINATNSSNKSDKEDKLEVDGLTGAARQLSEKYYNLLQKRDEYNSQGFTSKEAVENEGELYQIKSALSQVKRIKDDFQTNVKAKVGEEGTDLFITNGNMITLDPNGEVVPMSIDNYEEAVKLGYTPLSRNQYIQYYENDPLNKGYGITKSFINPVNVSSSEVMDKIYKLGSDLKENLDKGAAAVSPELQAFNKVASYAKANNYRKIGDLINGLATSGLTRPELDAFESNVIQEAEKLYSTELQKNPNSTKKLNDFKVNAATSIITRALAPFQTQEIDTGLSNLDKAELGSEGESAKDFQVGYIGNALWTIASAPTMVNVGKGTTVGSQIAGGAKTSAIGANGQFYEITKDPVVGAGKINKMTLGNLGLYNINSFSKEIGSTTEETLNRTFRTDTEAPYVVLRNRDGSLPTKEQSADYNAVATKLNNAYAAYNMTPSPENAKTYEEAAKTYKDYLKTSDISQPYLMFTTDVVVSKEEKEKLDEKREEEFKSLKQKADKLSNVGDKSLGTTLNDMNFSFLQAISSNPTQDDTLDIVEQKVTKNKELVSSANQKLRELIKSTNDPVKKQQAVDLIKEIELFSDRLYLNMQALPIGGRGDGGVYGEDYLTKYKGQTDRRANILSMDGGRFADGYIIKMQGFVPIETVTDIKLTDKNIAATVAASPENNTFEDGGSIGIFKTSKEKFVFKPLTLLDI